MLDFLLKMWYHYYSTFHFIFFFPFSFFSGIAPGLLKLRGGFVCSRVWNGFCSCA